jgi:hypothetical protein
VAAQRVYAMRNQMLGPKVRKSERYDSNKN